MKQSEKPVPKSIENQFELVTASFNKQFELVNNQ